MKNTLTLSEQLTNLKLQATNKITEYCLKRNSNNIIGASTIQLPTPIDVINTRYRYVSCNKGNNTLSISKNNPSYGHNISLNIHDDVYLLCVIADSITDL